MKNLRLILIFSITLSTACFVETKKSPVYVPVEKATKIENGDEYIKTAKKATENFRKLYSEGKYQELLDLIDNKSQLKEDRVYWDIRFNRINNELGKLEKSEYTRGNAFQKSETVEVRIEYVTKFEKDDGTKPRYELFYWELYKNGDVKLLEYKNGVDNEKGY